MLIRLNWKGMGSKMEKVIVKIGGSIAGEGLENVVNDVAACVKDKKIVIVHGGGPQIDSLSKRLGKEPIYFTSPSGFKSRFTDEETRDIALLAMAGYVNKKIVSLLGFRGVSAVGISGADGPTLIARRKDKLIVQDGGKKRVVRGDYSGIVEEVDGTLVNILLSSGFTPVIAPIALSHEGELVNVDGDRAAAQLAKAIGANMLISVTDVPGLMLDEQLVRKLTANEARRLIEEIGGGMKKKIFAALEAIRIGVPLVVVCSGLEENPITRSLKLESGTVITQ